MSYDEYPHSNFDPNTGREFSGFAPVRAFQKLTGRIGFNALLATIPSTEDTPLKQHARTVARHLLSVANINTRLDDPALLPGVTETGSQLSGAEPRSRSQRIIRAGLAVAAAAATAAVLVPPIMEFAENGAEKMERIYEDTNATPDFITEGSSHSSPGGARTPEYQYLYPDNMQLEP